jgi:diguanylate cyclase (GGDEF)-like protein/PAS domain S-box-containing protein
VESSSACIVITDHTGSIEYVNPIFEQITGYSQADVIGQNPDILQSGLTPPEAYRDLWDTISSGHEWQGEFINAKKNDQIYIESAKIAPVFDAKGNITHYVAVKEDITQRRKLENALEKISEEMTIILDALPAWVFYKDKENRFIRVNRAFAETMQMPKEKLEGVSLYDLYPKDLADQYWKDDLQVINSGKSKQKIVEPIPLSDGIHWVQTEKMPFFDSQGEIIGVVGFTIDITERKRLEDNAFELAITDELTGLNNRRGFFSKADYLLKLAKRDKKPCMLISADLDGLKNINDNLGHAKGDQALKEAASVFKRTFRDIDILARLGGDEFCILAIGLSPNKGAKALLSRLESEIKKINSREHRPFTLSISLGISHCDVDCPSNLLEMMALADRQMYENKRKMKTESSPE